MLLDASISVSALASSQTLEFSGFSSKSEVINKGTVNIDLDLGQVILLL